MMKNRKHLSPMQELMKKRILLWKGLDKSEMRQVYDIDKMQTSHFSIIHDYKDGNYTSGLNTFRRYSNIYHTLNFQTSQSFIYRVSI